MISEAEATQLVYQMLSAQDPRAASRVLVSVGDRLDEDRRERDAANAAAGIKPEFWCVSGHLITDYDNPDDVVVDSDPRAGSVIVVDGYAVVRRRYAVPVIVGDGLDEDDGTHQEIQWFDDRAQAENLAAHWNDPEPEAAPPATDGNAG